MSSDKQQLIQNAQIDLISELGIDNLPADQQEKILTQIGELLQQRILIRLADELSEEKRDELTKITEDPNATMEGTQAWLSQNVPNFEDMVLEEIGNYKKEMVDFVQGVLKQANA